MTRQVAIIGIDGSGKSSLASALPVALAAEAGLVAGSASGDAFWVHAPDQDLCGPGYHPHGYPVAARLAWMTKRLAKWVVNLPSLYPVVKVLQMLLQDNGARKLSARYGVDVMVSDGNLLLSSSGRVLNYRGTEAGPPTVDDIEAAFRHLLHQKPLSEAARSHLPPLASADLLAAVARAFKIQGIWLPDEVIFLDVPPGQALERIEARGGRIDRHENLQSMGAAREQYLRCLEALARLQGPDAVHVIPSGDLSPGQLLAVALDRLRPRLPARAAGPRGGSLHTSVSASLTRNVFSYRYLVRYLAAKFFEGAWRELFFPLSEVGRRFLRKGYSADVMRLIYEKDERMQPPLSAVFYGYPLHRAIYDRLQILTRILESELHFALRRQGPVQILTAPSGFAYDLLRPLEHLLRRDPGSRERIRLTAADLDPAGDIEPELEERARRLRIQIDFLKGDITGQELHAGLGERAPYDIALFVGLSAWLPKPALVCHLRRLRSLMRSDGVLVTDCFTPAGYALGGHYTGYQASYYEPQIYAWLLDYCGFDSTQARIESGANRINHVLTVPPGPDEVGGGNP